MVALLDPGAWVAVHVGVALVFAAASTSKFRALAPFRATLRDYGLVPEWSVPWLAGALPAAEILVAPGLPFPMLQPWPSVAAGALLVVFAVAMAVNLLRGRTQMECGCTFSGKAGGAKASHRLRWHFVARNLAAAGVLALPATGAPGLADTMTGVLGGVVLYLLQDAANTLWALPVPTPSARA